jgi:hypothetical protein
MKRNLLLLSVMFVAVLLLNSQSWAQQDPNDLGLPDSIIVQTFDCDHIYEADPGWFDSVRVAVYVTHDSNTFYSEHHGTWMQDSIEAFIVPLIFWHQPPGCADSVILPFRPHGWNNDDIYPDLPWMNRSIFRHIVDTHTGDTTYNRLLQMVENGKAAWSIYTDFESHSCDGDSGRAYVSAVCMNPANQKWWEGTQVLFATLTFHVYMSEACDTTRDRSGQRILASSQPTDLHQIRLGRLLPAAQSAGQGHHLYR